MGPLKDLTNTDQVQVHKIICERAAALADDLAREDPELYKLFPSGPIFREASEHTDKGGLTIRMLPGMEHADPKIVKKLRSVGLKAMKKSLIENQNLFVGLILGKARSNEDYFANFVQPGQQLSIPI